MSSNPREMISLMNQKIMLMKQMVEIEEEKITITEKLKWLDAEQALRDEIDKESKKSSRPKAPNTPRPKDSFEDEQDDTNTIVSGKTKNKQIRSVINRDVDATFARCDTITITEKYKKQTASLVLVRTRGETNWKRGAWKDEQGIAYTTPNVAWKALIGRTWGEEGPRQSNVWAKEGRLIAERNGFPVVDIYKYPFSVIMNLDECCGSYFGRNFSELTEADFRQI
jgi:hypothetical protein